METLHWENHNSNSFNVFIRDLSMGINANLKYMIEDFNKNDDKKKEIKKKHIKKKDLIIIEQNKKREIKKVKDDTEIMEFLFDNLNDNNIYDNFEKLKTDKGKQIYKFKLLCKFIKKQKEKGNDYMIHILNIYFNLKYGNNEYLIDNADYIKKSQSLDKKLQNYDYKTYMMKECSDYLPPLNFWEKSKLKLDDWQIEIINYIKNKKSVLVKAPTSSGKSFIAMSTGIIHNKVLYVCPAKPVVYQVGANFIKMGYRVHYLVDNMSHLSYDNKTNIFIGTPDNIEKYLPKIYTNFDYAVFDEIHNINDTDLGICYENIIKCITCNFLALSATIENIGYLREIFERIHTNKEIKYVEYKKRFINIQRWIFNDKLLKIHPLVCLEKDNFDSIKNISFTPYDCIILYEYLEDELDEYVEYLSPDNYFNEDKLLTLDDTKLYEEYLKNELERIYKLYPDKTNLVIDKFKKYKINKKDNLDDIVNFFRECKNRDLLPMIYFHTDEIVTKEIFYKVYNDLKTMEDLEYPYHYDILEKKDDLYKKYLEKREIYSDSIKIKTKDAHTEKNEKLNRYDKMQKDKYINDIKEFYEKCIQKCKKDTINIVNRVKNLKKELNNFISNPDFRRVDVYKKHDDFCFTRGEPMSGNEIKSIRREIKNTTGFNISYENPVFQLLKRGIGIYISSMPDEYNWIVQRLMSEKKLGIVISDKTLCLGIDLPIRSVSLSGYKDPNYTISDYLQMSGRAGRRGHDTQGNIIFHGVSNYIDLMKGKLPKLIGSDKKIGNSYLLLNELNKNISLKNIDWRINDINDKNTLVKPDINIKFHKLGWYLRYYDNIDIFVFVKKLLFIEKKIFMMNEDDREYFLFDFIVDELFTIDKNKYMNYYKKNKIDDKNIDEIVLILIDIADIFKDLVNSLDNKFMITKQYSKLIFDKCRILIYKYRGFE